MAYIQPKTKGKFYESNQAYMKANPPYNTNQPPQTVAPTWNPMGPNGGLGVLPDSKPIDTTQLGQVGQVIKSDVPKIADITTLANSNVGTPTIPPATVKPELKTAQAGQADMYSPENIAKLKALFPTPPPQAQPFAYDANTDQAYQADSKVAMNKVIQESAKRGAGGLYDSYTKEQLMQVAGGMIPQYQSMARNQYNKEQDTSRQRYLDEYNNISDILGLSEKQYNANIDATGQLPGGGYTLKGLEQMANIDKARESVNTQGADTAYKQAQTQTEISQGQGYDIDNEAKIQKAQDTQWKNRFGPSLAMTPENFKRVGAFDALMQDPNYSAGLTDINNNRDKYDIAALMGEAKASGDIDLFNALDAIRMQKVMSDPKLIDKYGAAYGLNNYDAIEQANKIQIDKLTQINKQIDNDMKTIEASYAEPMAKLKLDKAYSDLQQGLYDEFIKKVQASNITQYEKNKLILQGLDAQNIQSTINTRAANLQMSKEAHRTTEAAKLTKAEEAKLTSPYFKEYDARVTEKIAELNKPGMKNVYNEVTNAWEPSREIENDYVRNPTSLEHSQIYDYIMNLDITPTEKELLFKKNNIPRMEE